MKGVTLSVSDCSPKAAATLIVLPLSLHPFNLFILAMCTARTVLLYSNCILSIKKACFPWLLWCWNGSRGAIHIHSAVCFPPQLLCANSRIPIYILAVELNYCKHLCGPARQQICRVLYYISAPYWQSAETHCCSFQARMASLAVRNTVEWDPIFFVGMLEYLLIKFLINGITHCHCTAMYANEAH